MRKFLLLTSAAAVTGLMALSGTAAQAQNYVLADPEGREAAGPEVGVIDTTTADPRVTREMVDALVPDLRKGRPQYEPANVVGRSAPHPLFVDIREEQRPEPQQAAVPEPQAPDPDSLHDTLYFEFDEADLTPSARAKIDELAAVMQAWNLDDVEVSGHTDLAGPDAYNVALSERRAETVAGALRERGLSPRILETEWYGERRPAVPTEDGVRLQANRRVEIQAIQ
jgi:outer membrane protein OmpA-like peptidoglycan-associated protein